MPETTQIFYSSAHTKLKELQFFITGTFVLTLLGITLLMVNISQVSSLLLLPFSLKAFQKANRNIVDIWWKFCHKLGQFAGIRFTYTGDTPPQKENIILISNHQSMADVPCLFSPGYKLKRLGDMKWFAKSSLKHVPGIGWGMRFIGCLFVERNWQKDKNKVTKTFKNLIEDKQPFWLVIFAEGTRYKPHKTTKASKRIEKMGFKPLKNVMYPATRGFTTAVDALRDNLDAVYDITIHYPNGIPTLWHYMQGQVKNINIDIRRHPIDSLPKERNDLSKWLVEQFIKKDQLIEEMKK